MKLPIHTAFPTFNPSWWEGLFRIRFEAEPRRRRLSCRFRSDVGVYVFLEKKVNPIQWG